MDVVDDFTSVSCLVASPLALLYELREVEMNNINMQSLADDDV